jgi:hypothetical protein
MYRKFTIFLFVSFTAVTSLSAQVNIHDSAIGTSMFYATYSYQFPGGDLAQRFGSNSSIGGGFMYKTKSNWLFGLEGNFLFGQVVKNSDSLLADITNKEGFIIDQNGMIADIVYYMRGYSFYAKFGKLIPLFSPNPNSGFLILLGGGYLQNKIRIHNPGNTAPQLLDDYKKGYDRLNGGISLSASLGYLYLSNTRLLNFYLGFEFTQAWTKSLREYNFDLEKKDDSKYSSQYYGIKVCWLIPLYKRTPKEYYLY